MSQNVPPFEWNEKRLLAAQLLSEDHLTDDQVAEQAGVTRRQITRWKTLPEFQEKIMEFVRAAEKLVLKRGLGRRAFRLRQLNHRHELLRQLLQERAADPKMQRVPGGRTGLLVLRHRSVGSGPMARIVKEYELDAALLKELREHEKQAAIETGQWTEKKDVTSGGQPFKTYLGVDVDAV